MSTECFHLSKSSSPTLQITSLIYVHAVLLSQTLLLMKWFSFRPDKCTLQSGLLLIEKQARFQTVQRWLQNPSVFCGAFMSSRLVLLHMVNPTLPQLLIGKGGGPLQQLCVLNLIWKPDSSLSSMRRTAHNQNKTLQHKRHCSRILNVTFENTTLWHFQNLDWILEVYVKRYE